MTVACYVDVARRHKNLELMEAFAAGCNGRLIYTDPMPDPGKSDHAVIAKGLARRLVPKLQRANLGFWYIDSAYIQIQGRQDARIERSRFHPPQDLGVYSMDRAYSMGVRLQPWRRSGEYVLLCLPGPSAQIEWGIDMRQWWEDIEQRLRSATDRPIRIRHKAMRRDYPLSKDLEEAWCLVTHSSTTAVEAALAGVPVFCEPTCAAAPVGRTDLDIENPIYPEREDWIAALAWRQFSRQEIRSGMAWAHVNAQEIRA